MSPWCVGWGHERAARHCCSYGSGTCGSGMHCRNPSPVLNPPPCLDPSAVLPPQLCVLFTQHQTLLGGQIRVSILWKFRVFVELLLQFHKGCLPRRTDLLLLEHWIQLLLKEHLFPSACGSCCCPLCQLTCLPLVLPGTVMDGTTWVG